MDSHIESAKRTIGERVELFARNVAQYRHADYKEAQLRQEFLDPFFEALGWDVSNRQGWAEQYKEVVNEDALKIGDATKAPDYSFRIGGVRKFFAEAKKPERNIKSDSSSAYQLRRYAWSAKLPLSVLSDFEELAIYDCRKRPSPKDRANIGRANFFTYDQYLDRLPEIYDVFSKEAVLRGSFDRYAEKDRGRGTTPVDAEFLKEIEDWRTTLAKNIAQLNPRLSLDELNDAVQRTIDRVIFLRMAEDRGAETYGRLSVIASGAKQSPSRKSEIASSQKPLLAMTSGGVYAGLLKYFYDADAKYNSGLFDFNADRLTPRIKIDDDKLGKILEDLYYPQSPYEFSVLGADTLGNVYEQFLGKVIRLTPSHQARIEEKPEVKKAGGVYYTPTYIVDYIVKQTVGKLIEGKLPKEIDGLRILDPACGSGSFLLGAYQMLLDHHLAWYVNHRDEKQTQNRICESATGWRLTTAEKKRILLNNIFGVDIDRQAVEVTKLSLLLKVLEGENQQTLQPLLLYHERAPPNLDANIKCGNSLIGPDYFSGQMFADADELKRVNPFDWAREFPDVFHRRGAEGAEGFDVVIGNPPYVDSEWMTRARPDWREYCNAHYESAKGNWDLFCVFVERALRLCRQGGFSSMIVPNKMLSADYASALRQFIARDNTMVALRDYSRVPVFPVSVYPIVYVAVARKSAQLSTVTIELMSDNISIPQVAETREVKWNDLASLHDKSWSIIVSGDSATLLEKIEKKAQRLGEIAKVGGAATVSEAYEYKNLIAEHNSKMKKYFRLVNTGTLDRYAILWSERKTRYIKSTFEKPVIPQDKWNELSDKRRREAEAAKIIVGGMTKRLECAYDTGGIIAGKSTSVVLLDKIDLRYLLALLNSKLISYYYQRKFAGLSLQGGFFRVGPPQLKELPIHIPKNQAIHDRLVALVEQMLELHKQLRAARTQADRELYQRQIDATDAQIDALVYELYGLTEEEIRVVENA